MLQEKLKSLNLPALESYDEMLDTLRSEEYGYPPEAPISWEIARDEVIFPRFNASKAPLHEVDMKIKLTNGDFVLKFTYAIPKFIEKPPVLLQIQFSDLYHKYQPTDELLDRGYAVFSLNYQDVSPDRDDGFSEGLGAVIFKDGKRDKTSPGKIAMWSWALSRIMDFIETRDDLNTARVSVIGHSRLGKTALLTGAQDHRFFCAFSSGAGTSGDAITRGKQGETVEDICRQFPYWFCENYHKYRNKHDEMPFDQHFLIACNAPHYVYISSASEDIWADPEFQHLSCVAASSAFKNGFVTCDRAPQIGDYYTEGDIGFHLRWGSHFLAREDWLRFLDFIAAKA